MATVEGEVAGRHPMKKAADSAGGAGGTASSWSMPVARDLAGSTIGDFAIERLLGQGGMGEVYLARQVSLDRPVALKVLRPEWTSNPTYMARFEAEAWAAAKINHPNIVHIYSLGGVDDLRFIAMEYVQGTNLREYLVKKGPPDLALALAVLRQAGLAIGAAGEAGLVHRDIKPENLLLTRKGQVKVADFGLARLPDAEHMHLTAPGMTLGTPMYMSPEQVQGHEIDHRSDLYSLGVTAYHMLAGQPPFRGETAVALALKHVRDEPASLAVHRPDLPPQLVALVMKMMAKAPEDRFASAGEMLKELARVREAAQAATAAALPTLPEARLDEPRTSSGPMEATEAEGGPRSGFGGLWLAVVPALLVGGFLGWYARAEDLLSAGSPASGPAPGSWMANWEGVPRRSSAAAQYRYAQTRAPGAEAEAAWLAVPARFPRETDWAFASYLQLIRLDLRRGDAGRLDALARDIREADARSNAPRQDRKNLVNVAHAAASALRGDSKEVVASFQNLALPEPALAELWLEVITRAKKTGAERTRLDKIRAQLVPPLEIPPALLDRTALGAK